MSLYGRSVLFITSETSSVVQYQVRDLADAFNRLGWKTRILKDKALTFQQIADTVREMKPTFVSAICVSRAELRGTIPDDVPYVFWIQDHAKRFFVPPSLSTHPMDLTYCLLDYTVAEAKRVGIPNVRPLRMAVNELLYDAGEVRQEYRCDVAFVTNLYPPRLLGHDPELMMACAERSVGLPLTPWTQWMTASQAKSIIEYAGIKNPSQEDVVDLAINLPRYAQRVPPVLWAKELGLEVKVFGNGWDIVPGISSLCKGPVQNGRDLRDVYRSAAIHLHACGLSLHPRVMECSLSGGFILSQDCAIDTDCDLPMAKWSSRADFEEKALHFIRHPEARNEVSRKVRDVALARHTFVHRAQTILKDLGFL